MRKKLLNADRNELERLRNSKGGPLANENLGPNESSDAADLGSLLSHSISGKEIQEIHLEENTLINTERIPLASFETLQLITNPNPESDNYSCICVMYQPRKVHKSKVTLSVFRLYSLQGRGRTADQKNLQPKLNGQLCYELLKVKL